MGCFSKLNKFSGIGVRYEVSYQMGIGARCLAFKLSILVLNWNVRVEVEPPERGWPTSKLSLRP